MFPSPTHLNRANEGGQWIERPSMGLASGGKWWRGINDRASARTSNVTIDTEGLADIRKKTLSTPGTHARPVEKATSQNQQRKQMPSRPNQAKNCR